jgi:hypothetical protein
MDDVISTVDVVGRMQTMECLLREQASSVLSAQFPSAAPGPPGGPQHINHP